jgi:hypothetical protein
MYETAIYDAAWERAWAGASEFERRRYRSLDAASGLGVLMLVASGLPLGEAIKEATPHAGELDGTPTPR